MCNVEGEHCPRESKSPDNEIRVPLTECNRASPNGKPTEILLKSAVIYRRRSNSRLIIIFSAHVWTRPAESPGALL